MDGLSQDTHGGQNENHPQDGAGSVVEERRRNHQVFTSPQPAGGTSHVVPPFSSSLEPTVVKIQFT